MLLIASWVYCMMINNYDHGSNDGYLTSFEQERKWKYCSFRPLFSSFLSGLSFARISQLVSFGGR